MMSIISYNRLWETMRTKKISQYHLIKHHHFSTGQLDRLKKNMYVSTHTIEILCTILNCPVQDVMEVLPEADAPAGLGSAPPKQRAKRAGRNSRRNVYS